MGEVVKLILGIILICSLVIGTLWLATSQHKHRTEFCPKEYGAEYYYVNGYRGTDLCANDKGEVRYPRGW